MAEDRKINVGVIGLGLFGSRHASVCKNHPNYSLIGLADIKHELVDKYSNEYGVLGFTDYQELINIPGLQAVVIATSDQYHHQPCIDAANRGIHIFLEKPIADSSENARKIIEAVKINKTRLMVGHTLRYDPRYCAIKKSIENGDIGEIIHVYARRNATVMSGRRLEGRVESMIFQGVHDIDYLQWITCSNISKVYAESTSVLLKDLNVNDTVMATLRFSNNVIGLLEQSWALPAGSPSLLDVELEVIGSKGSIYLDLRSQSISIFSEGKLYQPDLIYGLSEHQHFLVDEHSQFIKYLNDEDGPIISGEDALCALLVAEAILESSIIGKPIVINH